MTGGFSDAKKSKLGLARTLKTLNSDLESANVLKSFNLSKTILSFSLD